MRVISRLASIFGRKKARRGLRVAVLLDHGEVSVAGIRDGHVVAVTSAPCAEEHALNAVVNAFCTEHDLHGAAATVIPAANEYQLLLVEAPPVPAAELADALRWKVKDLLQYSLDEAVVDGFALPEDAYRGRQKMVYTVAAKKAPLQHVCDELIEAGLVVDKIEIPEQLILRVMAVQNKGIDNTMVIALGRNRGLLCIVSDKAIYLCRTLDVSGSAIIEEMVRDGEKPITDNLVLEVQRSRDYYESQMGKGHIAQVLFAPMGIDGDGLADNLAHLLGVVVSDLPIDSANVLSDHGELSLSGVQLDDHVLLHGAGLAA